MSPSTTADISSHRRASQEQAWKIKERIDPVGPTGNEPMKVAEGFLGPYIEAAFMRESRGEFGNHEGRGNKKEQRRQHPETYRRRAVVRRRRNPARTQHRRNVEKKDVPETHLLAQLLDWIGRAVCGRAHRVTSSAGINSSCMRKFLRNGSVEFSKSAQGPNRVTRPSWRKTITSASFFAKCVSCVTTIDVF